MKKRKVEVPDKELENLNTLFLKSCIVIDEKSKKYAASHCARAINRIFTGL